MSTTITSSGTGGVRVLLAGASGFIGTRVASVLSTRPGFDVTASARSARGVQRVEGVSKVATADLVSPAGADAAVMGQAVVVNLVYDFDRSADANLRLFINLCDACIRNGVERFVHVSSIAVYDGWPDQSLTEQSPRSAAGSGYKSAKFAMEELLESHARAGRLHSTILQPTIVYGPRSRLWTDLIVEQMLTGKVVLPADAQGCCNAVYVDDVADAVALAVDYGDGAAERFIVSGPDTPTWRAYFERYDRLVGRDSIQYTDFPASIDRGVPPLGGRSAVMTLTGGLRHMLGRRGTEAAKILVWKLRKLRGSVLHYPDSSRLALCRAVGRCSSENARARLGYLPRVGFDEGFARTADYIEKRLREDPYWRRLAACRT